MTAPEAPQAGHEETGGSPPQPTPHPTANTAPPAPPPRPPLSDLEVQAAVYQVAGLPEVFRTGSVVLPPDGTVEVCDALAFVQPPLPFRLTWTLLKEGKPAVVGQSDARPWVDIPVPDGYGGGVLRLEATRPVVAYKISTPEVLLMGSNRTRILRDLVAPAGNPHRLVLLSREGVRQTELPSDPRAIALDPRTRDAWKDFLSRAGAAH